MGLFPNPLNPNDTASFLGSLLYRNSGGNPSQQPLGTPGSTYVAAKDPITGAGPYGTGTHRTKGGYLVDQTGTLYVAGPSAMTTTAGQGGPVDPTRLITGPFTIPQSWSGFAGGVPTVGTPGQEVFRGGGSIPPKSPLAATTAAVKSAPPKAAFPTANLPGPAFRIPDVAKTDPSLLKIPPIQVAQLDPRMIGQPTFLGAPAFVKPGQVTTGQLPVINAQALAKQILAVNNVDWNSLSKTARNQAIAEVQPIVASYEQLQQNYRSLGRREMLDVGATANAAAQMAQGIAPALQTDTNRAVAALAGIGNQNAAGLTSLAAQGAANVQGTPTAAGINLNAELPGMAGALKALGSTIPAQGLAAQGLALQGEAAQAPGLLRAAGTQTGLMAQAAQEQNARDLDASISQAVARIPGLTQQNFTSLADAARQQAAATSSQMIELAKLSGLTPAEAATLQEHVNEYNATAVNQANQFNSNLLFNTNKFNAGAAANWRTALAGIEKFNVGAANAASIATARIASSAANAATKGSAYKPITMKDGSVWAFNPQTGDMAQVKGPTPTGAAGLKQTDIANLGKRVKALATGGAKWVTAVPGAPGVAGTGHFIPDPTQLPQSFATAVNTVASEVPSWTSRQVVDFVISHSDKYAQAYNDLWRQHNLFGPPAQPALP
jgi:hypothetical protein